jgi:DNA-binding NarL/FixJ family response regulator
MPNMDQGKVRVWLDDPNAIFRRGMASCLSAGGFSVVGESSNLVPTPDLARTNVLVFDLDERGPSTPVRLVRGTDVRLVGVARSVSEEALFDALEAQLAGFLLRADLTPDGLINAVRAVANGNGSLPSGLLARLLDGLAKGGRRGAAGQLSGRELSVLRLLASGDSTREIAGRLCYSERTVKNIVHDTLVKMNCRTRAHAVALATRQGFI